MPYVKLDTGILDSTLWLSDANVRVVFITMLAMAKPDGMCEATAPGIARRANLSLEHTREAIKVLEAPDEDSRSLDCDGRRIVRVDSGYFIVNYEKYRQRDYTAAERKRRERARRKAVEAEEVTNVTRDVTPVTPDVTQAEAEAEAEAEKASSSSPDGDRRSRSRDPVPYERIRRLYNEILPEWPEAIALSTNRKRYIAARWRDPEHLPTLEHWERYFRWVREQDFLMRSAREGKGWAKFDWLLNEQNLIKVYEGIYAGARAHGH